MELSNSKKGSFINFPWRRQGSLKKKSLGDAKLPHNRSRGALTAPPPVVTEVSAAQRAHPSRLDKSKSVDQSDLPNGGSHSAAVLYRDGHAALLLSNSLSSLSNLDNKDSVYSQFMTVHKCYDLVPTSTKIVVFDTKLNVKKAFFALVYNGVRSAPLWNSEKKEYIGMLTITDFINILRTNYNSPAGILQELEDHKIWTWLEQLEKGSFTKKAFISVGPDESLFSAVKCLCDNKIHRLPVVDYQTGNVLYVLTHKRLLRFLYLYIFDLPRPSFMSKTPKELEIGQFAHVQTTTAETPLIDALNQFIEHRVSALPVVDRLGKVVDIYAKFDVINLAAEKKYENLNITVREALKHRADYFEGVLSCKETDNLMTVIETLVKAEVHRIAIVDDAKVLKGIVSLSDILYYLVVKSYGGDIVDDHYLNAPPVVEEEMGVAES